MATRHLETEILIDAAPEDVWHVLADWAEYPQWNPFIVSLEGEMQVGSQLRAQMALGKRRMTFTPRMVAVVQQREFRWLGSAGFKGIFDGEHSFAIEPANGGGTRFVHAESFRGVAVGIAMRLIGESTREGFEAMNRALKKRCETPPASSPSNA